MPEVTVDAPADVTAAVQSVLAAIDPWYGLDRLAPTVIRWRYSDDTYNATSWEREVWINSRVFPHGGFEQTLAHELAHVVDKQLMTDADRARVMGLLTGCLSTVNGVCVKPVTPAWGLDGSVPYPQRAGELFAETVSRHVWYGLVKGQSADLPAFGAYTFDPAALVPVLLDVLRPAPAEEASMLLSQNGWSANDRSVITSITVPGGKLAVRGGDVAVIFTWLAQRFNDDVERLQWPGCWGYAERLIRGSATAVSNHASGTAVDFNAPLHPLGRSGTFTAREVRAIRAILTEADGVIRWGGDYSGRKDEMHFEINASAARVAALARSLEDDMAITDADGKVLWGYDQDGKRRQAWSYLQTADANARKAAHDSAAALEVVKALAAKDGLTADEIAAAAERGAKAAIDAEIDGATVNLNVSQP